MYNLILLLMVGVAITLCAYHFYLVGYNTGVEEVFEALNEELEDAN
jgi:hypothetical protein